MLIASRVPRLQWNVHSAAEAPAECDFWAGKEEKARVNSSDKGKIAAMGGWKVHFFKSVQLTLACFLA